MSWFTRPFARSRVARYARELAAYSAVLLFAGCALAFLADGVMRHAAKPVGQLLKLGDGFALVDERAATPVQTASRVLEGDSWLENLKSTWQSGRSLGTDSRLGGPSPAADRKWSRGSDGKIHRTMCVRLCDGYYFPVSFATTEENFERDEQVCARSCSAATRLYVYRNPGQDPDDMVSRDGQPYSKLPAAFRFRTKIDQSCKCTPDPWSQEAQDRHRQYAELAAAKPQVAKAEDPKGNRVTDGGRKKTTKSGRVTEALPPPTTKPLAPSASVRVAASERQAVVSVQMLTVAQGSVPQRADTQPLAAMSLTAAPSRDAVRVTSTAPDAGASVVADKLSKRANARAGARQPKPIASVSGSAGGTGIPIPRPSRSFDWKVSVFAAR